MSVQFNNNELDNSIYNLEIVQHESMPKREIEVIDEPTIDGQQLIDSFFREKRIRFKGFLKGDDQADLEAKIDNLKDILNEREPQYLSISFRGGTRRYLAMIENFAIKRQHYDIDITRYQGDFVIISGEGLGNTFTYQDIGDVTTSSWADSLDFGGNKDPKPIIYITVRNSNNTEAIDVRNNTTGQGMLITRPFVNGEVLKIDINNMTVEVDSVEVVYEGDFPEFDAGSNDLQVRAFIKSIYQSQLTKSTAQVMGDSLYRLAQINNIDNVFITKVTFSYHPYDYTGIFNLSIHTTEGSSPTYPSKVIVEDGQTQKSMPTNQAQQDVEFIFSFPYPWLPTSTQNYAFILKPLGTFGANSPRFYGSVGGCPFGADSGLARSTDGGENWSYPGPANCAYVKVYYFKPHSNVHLNVDFAYLRRWL